MGMRSMGVLLLGWLIAVGGCYFGSKLNGGCSMTNVNVSEDDPQRRLDRAEEVRRLAEDLREPETRRMMLSTSEGYDKLAKRAEERARKKPSKQSA